MDILAQASRATRRFGNITAVSAADLAVGRGEVVGLLGANGGGKTTLIRLLLGLLRPSDGTVWFFGAPPSIATRRRVGYVPQTLGLYADAAQLEYSVTELLAVAVPYEVRYVRIAWPGS